MLCGEKFDHRIDVYSLAAVIFRALAGQPLFPGENPALVLLRVVREARPKLTAFRPELSTHVDDWVQYALALDPRQRYPDVVSMWNGLLAAVQQGRSPSSLRARYIAPFPQ
jgi:serine/threonine-protein kinase